MVWKGRNLSEWGGHPDCMRASLAARALATPTNVNTEELFHNHGCRQSQEPKQKAVDCPSLAAPAAVSPKCPLGLKNIVSELT